MKRKEKHQVMELDRMNMQPILDEYDLIFSPSERLALIEEEMSEGATFIVVKEEDDVVAYVEYFRYSDHLYVPNIQIRSDCLSTSTYLQLFSSVVHVCEHENIHSIKSKVHTKNEEVLSLYQSFGFIQIDTLQEHQIMEVQKQDLQSSLQHYKTMLR